MPSGILRSVTVRLILIVSLVLLAPFAFPAPAEATAEAESPADDRFLAAQSAASEGRYREVVDILTAVLAQSDLPLPDQVVAFANRGIAYSLLGAYERARQDLEAATAIEPRHNLSLNHLGMLAERVDEDAATAASLYTRAAEAGFAPAMLNLANLLRDGRGVAQDIPAAVEWYERAAEQEYSLAYTPLGRIYMAGEGVPRDTEKAVSMFTRAVEAGVIGAHLDLGVALEEGLGVARNPEEAAAFYRYAAMQGNSEAQNRLGYLYRRGVGVAQDFLEAAKWYRLSADQGNVQAMNRLAWLLATCPARNVCNGEAALELARQALAIQPSASILDSLAAAQARTGDFAAAVATMERALDEPGGAGNAGYRRRLEMYRNGSPYQL